MPTATLTYALPEEREELDDALQGAAWRRAVWALDQELRRRVKYVQALTEPERSALDDARRALWEAVDAEGLTLE